MADGYTVGKARQTSIFDNGRLEQVWVVPYTTADGDQGQVEIPVAGFTADKAHEAIRKEVAELNALKG